MPRLRGGLGCTAVLTILAIAPNASTSTENATDSTEQASSQGLPIRFGGPFTLIDHHGNTVSDKDFAGRFMLIFFGYTYCPDICPTNLTTMAQALKDLGDAGDAVQPLFISVDPERDTIEVLEKYVNFFHPRLIGLRGSEEQVSAAAHAYKIHRGKVITQNQTSTDDYLVNHSSITYLMGPTGDFVTLFPHDTKPKFMTKTIAKYVQQANL
ncbi:MAG: SCO family protein [Gammaproteobacteria bacterium]|nr:SCO family protein [Gammaproteobacteria bacterium]